MISLARRVRTARNSIEVNNLIAETASEPIGARAAQLIRRVEAMTSTEFRALEEAGSRLAERVQLGRTYSMPNAIREMAITDAFKNLGINSRSSSSWDQIDEALRLMTHGGRNPVPLARARLSANFLKNLLAEIPSIRQARPDLITPLERKLASALGRTPAAENYWRLLAVDGASR